MTQIPTWASRVVAAFVVEAGGRIGHDTLVARALCKMREEFRTESATVYAQMERDVVDAILMLVRTGVLAKRYMRDSYYGGEDTEYRVRTLVDHLALVSLAE